MFRADFLPFTSKIVEHSRYLPAGSYIAKNIRPLPAPGRVANPMSQVIFQTTSKDGNDIMLEQP
jgi:hypothetical protein